jgi:hypothetical protein
MGHFGVGESDVPNHPTETRLCIPMHVSDLLTFNKKAAACMNKSMEQSKDYAEKYGPTAKKKASVCVKKTSVIAGEGLADFAMTAAEVYRQECKSDHRGDDAMFFMETNQQGDNNSMMDTASVTASVDERRDSNSDPPSRPRTKSESGPFKSPRSMRFPEAIHIMKDPAADSGISPPPPPPRVDRMDTKHFEPEEYAQKQVEHTGDLRDARLELFRAGRLDGLSEPEARLARTLEDLDRQDQVIDGLKRQLQMTQNNLDETTDSLAQSRAIAQEKQFKATEIRARAVQEKKKLEGVYQEERELNKRLQSSLSQLQSEVTTLRMSLRSSRSGGRGNDEIHALSPPRPPRDEYSAITPQIISLRAEIVDLRSQLAEAHAANLEDNSSLNTFGELEELRRKLRNAESERSELREKDLDARKLDNRHRQAESSLKEEIELIESTSKDAKVKLEEKLKASVTSENEVRSELIKTKANLQRLERERSRKRLHSSADVDTLNKQLNRAREDIARLKQQLVDEQKAARENSVKLRKELDDVKKDLVKTNKEVLSKSTSSLRNRRKLEQDSANHSQERKELQLQLKSKDEKVKAQARKIDELQGRLKNRGANYVDSSASNQQSSLLEGEVILRKANEASLRAELKLQKTLLDEARAEAAKAESNPNLRTLDETNVGNLRRKLDHFKNLPEGDEYQGDPKKKGSSEFDASLRKEIEELKKKVASFEAKSKSPAHESPGIRLKAVEQSFLNQICMLKARLSESEAKCKEEKFRAEEERRISRENEAKRVDAIKRLRQEKDQALDHKAQLGDELLDLRRQILVSASSGDVSAVSSKSLKSESTEVPDNVKRLRNELALARARLSAARDQSRSIDERSRLIDQRSRSGTSQASRLEKTEDESLHSLPDSPDSPDKSIDSAGSSWAPPSKKSIEKQSSPPLTGATDEVKTHAASYTTPPRTIATKKRAPVSTQQGMTHPTTTRVASQPGAATAKKAVVEDLERQLEQSSKRLLQANSRLKGLVENYDAEGAKSPLKNIFRTKRPSLVGEAVVTRDSDSQDDSHSSGVIDEILSYDSGSIEVNRYRFADV